jgi:sec-independent protein translocase protein TatB
MFFDIGWPELMLIGIVALVVIGPKDLPAALRVAGYWVRKARTLSREFHSSVEQMMREVELHEVQNELKKATEFNLDHEFNKIMDPVNDPAAGPKLDAPDYLDTTPAPADPVPLTAETVSGEKVSGEVAAPEAPAAEDEPELPLPMPAAKPPAEHEPARAAEPSKP